MPNMEDAGAIAPAFVLHDLKSGDVWQLVRVLRKFKLAEARKMIDEDLLKSDTFGCHPCRNTASLRLATADLLNKVIPALGHEPTMVTLPEVTE